MFRNPGYRIGRLFGIQVTLHPSWFILLALLTLSLAGALRELGTVSPIAAYAIGLVTALLGFASLLAHEYGHALTARRFGIGTERIMLFILGGVAQIRSEPKRPIEEFLIAIAGPAVSLLLAAVFFGIALTAEMFGVPEVFMLPAWWLVQVNLVFAIFNMIPGFPMDGGRVLRAIIWKFSGDFLTATRIASRVGQGFSYILMATSIGAMLLGHFQFFTMFLLGLFLNWLARSACQQAEMHAAFQSVRVRDLMRPVQVVVPADLSLRDVVRQYVYRLHSDRFPVVRGPSLLGYISADEIAAVDRDQWDWTSAEKLVRPYLQSEILSPDVGAFNAFQKVARSGRADLPVFQGRQLIGYLFLNDVMNYLRRFPTLQNFPSARSS